MCLQSRLLQVHGFDKYKKITRPPPSKGKHSQIRLVSGSSLSAHEKERRPDQPEYHRHHRGELAEAAQPVPAPDGVLRVQGDVRPAPPQFRLFGGVGGGVRAGCGRSGRIRVEEGQIGEEDAVVAVSVGHLAEGVGGYETGGGGEEEEADVEACKRWWMKRRVVTAKLRRSSYYIQFRYLETQFELGFFRIFTEY